jgi:hypothetical protein
MRLATRSLPPKQRFSPPRLAVQSFFAVEIVWRPQAIQQAMQLVLSWIAFQPCCAHDVFSPKWVIQQAKVIERSRDKGPATQAATKKASSFGCII